MKFTIKMPTPFLSLVRFHYQTYICIAGSSSFNTNLYYRNGAPSPKELNESRWNLNSARLCASIGKHTSAFPAFPPWKRDYHWRRIFLFKVFVRKLHILTQMHACLLLDISSPFRCVLLHILNMIPVGYPCRLISLALPVHARPDNSLL